MTTNQPRIPARPVRAPGAAFPTTTPADADAAVDLAIWVLAEAPARYADGVSDPAILNAACDMAERACEAFDRGWMVRTVDLAIAAAIAIDTAAIRA